MDKAAAIWYQRRKDSMCLMPMTRSHPRPIPTTNRSKSVTETEPTQTDQSQQGRTIHTTRSSYREAVLEHLFTGALLKTLWRRGVHAEVLRPFVDDAGYDLVVDANCVIRHIQLKSSFLHATTSEQRVHQDLGRKPSGCVVWLRFDEATLRLDEYLWFGAAPGHRLPDLSRFKVARHTKGDASGRKAERPMVRVIPKGKFDRIPNMDQLAQRLFGLDYSRAESPAEHSIRATPEPGPD